MDYYPFFHLLHISMVIVSGGLFLIRGSWMLLGSAHLQQKWVRIVPHIIDTFLLISAICLLFILEYNPLTTGWLAAKIVALVCYIVAGTIALKRGSTMVIRSLFLIMAIAIFSYIIAVALTRSASIGVL